MVCLQRISALLHQLLSSTVFNDREKLESFQCSNNDIEERSLVIGYLQVNVLVSMLACKSVNQFF